MGYTSNENHIHHRLLPPQTVPTRDTTYQTPNRRSPREVQLIEGRPLNLNTTKKAESGFSPTYLIRLENVDDRDEALKLRGYVLYALVDEKVNNLLK